MELTRHELRLARSALRYTLLSGVVAHGQRDGFGHPVPWAGEGPERRAAYELLQSIDAHLQAHDRALQDELQRALEAAARREGDDVRPDL